VQEAQGGSDKPAGSATEQQAEPKPEEAAEDDTEPAEGIIEEQAQPEAEPEKPEEAAEDDTEPEAESQPKLEPNQPPDKWGTKTEAAAADDWGALRKASSVPKTPGYVTNFFYDTSLRNALSEIALQADVIIVPDSSVQGLVTCDLQDVPLEQALRIVLSSGNFVFRQMDGYILVGSADSESPSFTTLSETRRIKMNHIKAEEAVKMLPEPTQKLVSANVTSNTVSVTAPPALLERIISDLKLIDQPSRHVILDARVVAMEHGDLLNLGVQWGWPQISAGILSSSEHHGGGAPERVEWPWGIQIGYTTGKEFTNSLQMTLNLLTQNDEATVISSPQVLAQDGQEAEIKVVTEEYFKISQESYMYTRFELETIETGTTLTITPRIGDNNEITLEITTEVSDVIARGEDNLPVVTRRTTKNTVRIEDGGTAAVAGLMDSRQRLTESRAPGLGNIPVLGALFRNTNSSSSSRQVAVFVTARLMPEAGPRAVQAFPERAPIEPVGEEFKMALQEILSRLRRGDEKP
jgi:type II secretory pathway component HofQ